MDRVECPRLFRADRARVETRGRLHGNKRKQLEQVVRHHVAQGARCIVKAPATAHGKRFGHGNLHVIDMVAIPYGLEQPIRESQYQDVLHGLLSEIMVYAIDLTLFEQIEEFAIERLRRGEIDAARLLDNESAPRPILFASETCLTEMAADRCECLRRRREIEEPVTVRIAFPFKPREYLIKFPVSGRIIGVAADVADAAEQPAYDVVVDLARRKPA